MKLRYSPTSPYVRKVIAVAMELGIHETVERIETASREDGSDIWRDNPLGKVPALRLEDGSVLIDSPVICRYLTAVAVPGSALLPTDALGAVHDQNLEALADGVCDAAVARRLEMGRPATEQSAFEMDRYARKMAAGLDRLEQMAASGGLSGVTVGTLAVACALGYMDFRYADEPWRPTRPALAAWNDAFSSRPSIAQTRPS